MKKRMLSALLCLCMMLTMMPAAFAVGTDDSSSSESVSTTLPEAKDGVYTLDKDVSINTIGLGAGETVYDLNGHTLTYTGGTVQPQQGQTLTFRDSSVSGTERGGTLKLTGVEGTKAALNPQTGATVNASNIKVECSGSAFFPQGDAAAVNITSCDVKADVYCVGTNAAATDNYGVKINLTDSTFTATSGNDDDCAVMINVAGTLNIDNCTISGHRQGVLVRAGKANITNSSIKTLGTYSDADAYYDSAWQSGNEVPAAALTVGNYAAGAATAYKADAVVKLTNTKLTAENNFPALYVDANATCSANVTITGDDTNVSGAVMKGQQTAAGAISIAVSGGTFSNSVADYVSSDLKYEVSGDGTFTYYETSNEAQQAASEMDNAVVKVVDENTLYDTVTLDYNDGTGHVDTVYVVEGDTYTLPAVTRDNYTFDGWYADGETEPAQTYTAVGGQTVTFTAQWDRNSSSGGGGGSGSSSYAVSVSSVSNGSVTVSPKNASKGATVTITVAPNEGYELGSLTVTDANGNRISLTNAGDGKYTFTMPSSKVTVTANFTAVEEVPEQVGSFTDVNTDDWFAEAVQYMLDNEMMNGTSATTFGPNTTTTRGMIVTILYRLEGEPDAAASSFTDVASNMYYADAINWAAANGIVNGITTTTFGPDNAITREQMAAILYRYAQYKGYDVTASNDLGSYTDASQISAYATTAMQWANAEGLITGNTTTTINPIGNATRAEVATILMRFCENIAG